MSFYCTNPNAEMCTYRYVWITTSAWPRFFHVSVGRRWGRNGIVLSLHLRSSSVIRRRNFAKTCWSAVAAFHNFVISPSSTRGGLDSLIYSKVSSSIRYEDKALLSCGVKEEVNRDCSFTQCIITRGVISLLWMRVKRAEISHPVCVPLNVFT